MFGITKEDFGQKEAVEAAKALVHTTIVPLLLLFWAGIVPAALYYGLAAVVYLVIFPEKEAGAVFLSMHLFLFVGYFALWVS